MVVRRGGGAKSWGWYTAWKFVQFRAIVSVDWTCIFVNLSILQYLSILQRHCLQHCFKTQKHTKQNIDFKPKHKWLFWSNTYCINGVCRSNTLFAPRAVLSKHKHLCGPFVFLRVSTVLSIKDDWLLSLEELALQDDYETTFPGSFSPLLRADFSSENLRKAQEVSWEFNDDEMVSLTQ